MTNSKTIEYYNKNAAQFTDSTILAEVHDIQKKFLGYLDKGASILDFGCGSGRDTKYFLENGYKVEAIDGSEELCKLASEYAGINVQHMFFQDLCVTDKYDGIWACSSILHLNKAELRPVLGKMLTALKKAGIIYSSFKYGDFEGERKGRYFTDFTKDTFEEFIKDFDGIRIVDEWISQDVRPDRGDEKWLNLILQKVATN